MNKKRESAKYFLGMTVTNLVLGAICFFSFSGFNQEHFCLNWRMSRLSARNLL